MDNVVVRPEPFGSPIAQELANAANAVNAARYGAPDKTPIRVEEFDPACGGGFLVCYLDDRPVGCAGFRRAEPPATPETAELKRMYVDESLRRHGLGRRLLAELEQAARAQGYTALILDTGARQPEAIALYEQAGFRRIPGYSIYRDSPNNRAYGKQLTVSGHAEGRVRTLAWGQTIGPAGVERMASMSVDDLGPFAKWLGLEIDEATGEQVIAQWVVRTDLQQPYGIVHGGVHCSVVETLASMGAALWLDDRGKVVGVNNSTDFYRAATQGRMRSVARPIHRGRSQQVWVVETTDEQDRLISRGQVRLQNLS